MKKSLFKRALKSSSSSLVKFIQEVLWKMLLKRKVGSKLRLPTARWAVGVGAGRNLTTKFKGSQICLAVQHHKTHDFLSQK